MNLPAAAPEPRFAVPERLEAAGFAAFDPAAQLTDLAGATMGTTWSVRAAMPVGLAPALIDAAVQARLDGLVAQMSHWDAASSLSRFNAATAGSWLDLPPDFDAVVAAALEIAEQSDGAFDPAIGRLTDCWGLGPRAVSAEPAHQTIEIAREACGWRKLPHQRPPGQLRQPGGVWLDLSGIAKGYAADAVADTLGQLGVVHALVEVGGECVGRGLRPDGDAWWVELESPPSSALAPIRVALHQLAVATSGEYLRGAHALDPATGYPPRDGPAAVSVVHRSCMVADAWASAFAVLPEAQGCPLADRMSLAVRAVTRDGREWLSQAMQAMLD